MLLLSELVPGLLVVCKVRFSFSSAQLPAPEAVPSNDSVAHATDVTKDGGGVKGGEFSITDSDKVHG